MDFGRVISKRIASDIAKNQSLLQAIHNGLSTPGGTDNVRAVLQRQAGDLEAEIEQLHQELLQTPLHYYRDCSFCVGECKGH